MCLVWVRSVLGETKSSRAICGPVNSLSSSRDLQLPLAQRVRSGGTGPAPALAVSALAGGDRCEQAPHVLVVDAHLLGVTQQRDHGSALVQEKPDVPIGLGRQRPRREPGIQGLLPMPLRVVRQGLQHADLEETPGAPGCLGGVGSRPTAGSLVEWRRCPGPPGAAR